MNPLLVKGFLVFRPTVIFRHFWRFASVLLLICWRDFMSNMSATNSERNKKIATHCYMLVHTATWSYIKVK